MAGKIEGLQLLGPGKLIDPADAFGLAHGLDAVQLAPAQEVGVATGNLSALRKRKTSALQVSHGQVFGAPLSRTLSAEESGRSSASLGTGVACNWRGPLLADSENDGDSPASLLRFTLPSAEEALTDGTSKRRRVTPGTTPSARNLGHLCNAAAALSGGVLSSSCEDIPPGRPTPDMSEPQQQPLSCCPSPDLPGRADTTTNPDDSSSSDLDSSSPESCYDSAFIAPDEIASELQQQKDLAHQALARQDQLRASGASMARVAAGQRCLDSMLLPTGGVPCMEHGRVFRRQRLGHGGGVYRFGQARSRLSVPGAASAPQHAGQHKPMSSVLAPIMTRQRSRAAQQLAQAHNLRPPCGSPATSLALSAHAPAAPVPRPVPFPSPQPMKAPAAGAQPDLFCLESTVLQEPHSSAPAKPILPPQQQQQGMAVQVLSVQSGGNPTAAMANLMAGHSLARLPPCELALLIANHNGSDPALTQALQCAMSALSDIQLGAVGCALQELNRALRGPKGQAAVMSHAQRLQPGTQLPLGGGNAAIMAGATGVKGPALSILRMPGPLLPAQAQMQLELCRQLQQGTPAAVCVPSWHQVFTMWSRGTDMVQADTPAFGVHLWTRVQPMVSAEHVASLGACKPWETVALACLWVAAKHEEARRALPPASRLAPLASCNARVLCAVEIHVLELVGWAPLSLWDDPRHSKGVPVPIVPPSNDCAAPRAAV